VGEPQHVERSFSSVVRAKEATAEAIAERVGEPRLDLASASLPQMEYS
jgi:hypothetical protein